MICMIELPYLNETCVSRSTSMKKDIGSRRVQLTGRGSYILSLPKIWAKKVVLKKGSEMILSIENDLSLKIIPRKTANSTDLTETSQKKEYLINISTNGSIQSICRKITALYVTSSGDIRVRFRNSKDAPKYRRKIRTLVIKTLLGSEITKEKEDEITIRNLVKHEKYPVEQTIRRMSLLALFANMDAILALKELDIDRVQDVIESQEMVRRLGLYVVRQLKFSLEHNTYDELGFKTPKECLGYRIVSSNIERIAD